MSKRGAQTDPKEERSRQDRQILDIIASARRASLGTLQKDGAPQVTMTSVAADGAYDIILLLSTLSSHSGNLTRDPRASLLLIAPSDEEDPMAGPRLTLFGEVEKIAHDEDANLRTAYLAHNPEAELYAGFGDFAIHRFTLSEAHLVAGFGQVRKISRLKLELAVKA